MNSIIEMGRLSNRLVREVPALEHLGDGHLGRQLEHFRHVERRTATRSCIGSRGCRAAGLVETARERTSAYALHLVTDEPFPRLRLAAGITDLSREVADDQHRRVTLLLEVPELAQHDGPPEGDRRCGGVESQFDPQRTTEAELLREALWRLHHIDPTR